MDMDERRPVASRGLNLVDFTGFESIGSHWRGMDGQWLGWKEVTGY